METVLRALTIYLFLMLVFRIAGQRSIAKITTFDFVLLLVIGEATQNALLGQDYSMTSAFIAIRHRRRREAPARPHGQGARRRERDHDRNGAISIVPRSRR